jgi:hypothetical protein
LKILNNLIIKYGNLPPNSTKNIDETSYF